MKNPFGDRQIPGSHHNMKERVFQKVKSANLHDRILDILQKAYENAWTTHRIESRGKKSPVFPDREDGDG